MSIKSAEALVAKLQTDPNLAAKLRGSPDQASFLEAAKKEGYDVTLEEFRQATQAFQKSPGATKLSNADVSQMTVGLSIVGVDYAFTVAQTTQG